jgi:hypothetical protein
MYPEHLPAAGKQMRIEESFESIVAKTVWSMSYPDKNWAEKPLC